MTGLNGAYQRLNISTATNRPIYKHLNGEFMIYYDFRFDISCALQPITDAGLFIFDSVDGHYNFSRTHGIAGDDTCANLAHFQSEAFVVPEGMISVYDTTCFNHDHTETIVYLDGNKHLP